MHANSFDAHRALQLAADRDLASELLGVLQRELFSGHANVYGHAFLADAAAARHPAFARDSAMSRPASV